MDFKVTELISLAFSTVALLFTFRKDAHRLTLEVTPLWNKYIDVLGVGNDSSFAVGILSVGYFNASGDITWLAVGDFKINKMVTYPIRIEPRSLFYCKYGSKGTLATLKRHTAIAFSWSLAVSMQSNIQPRFCQV
jgi:hypothetical protein